MRQDNIKVRDDLDFLWSPVSKKKDKYGVEVYTGNGSVEKVKAEGPGIQRQLHGTPETSLGYSGLCL